MKKLFVLALVVVAAVACNKDQQAVKKLEGTWNMTKMETTVDLLGTPVTIDVIGLGGSGTMTFTNCKLKNDEWCNVSTTFTFPDEDPEESVDLYRVTGDGTMLEVKESDTSSTITAMTIIELTKEDLKVTFTDADLGDVEAELKKQ